MAIFTRWGNQIEVTGYCGKHRPDKTYEFVLLRCRFEDGVERHLWMYTLKANGGLNEIEEAACLAPEIKLSPEELKKAMKEAE